MTETEAFIPVEFVYDLPTPTVDAGLCDNAERARRRPVRPGEPAGRTAPRHRHRGLPGGVLSPAEGDRAAGDRRRGRGRAAREGLLDARRGHRGAAGPRCPSPTRWWRGASASTSASRPGDTVVAALNEVTGDRAVPVTTWEEWVEAMEGVAAAVAGAVAHGDGAGDHGARDWARRRGAWCLRVGLVQEFVKTDPAGRPMVLLLGCDTAVSKAEPETFIARLRDVGAAVVVGTVSPVLGENAAPVAVALLGELRRTVTDRRSPAVRWPPSASPWSGSPEPGVAGPSLRALPDGRGRRGLAPVAPAPTGRMRAACSG